MFEHNVLEQNLVLRSSKACLSGMTLREVEVLQKFNEKSFDFYFYIELQLFLLIEHWFNKNEPKKFGLHFIAILCRNYWKFSGKIYRFENILLQYS